MGAIMDRAVNLDVFAEYEAKFPPGHTKDSSASNVSKAIYALIRLLQPSHVVEVGTFEGATSIWIARALEENGRGTFTGYEVDVKRAEATNQALNRSVRTGRWNIKAQDIMQEPYVETDFLFLDCEKTMYGAAFSKCLIPVNGYVVAHDTTAWPAAVQFARYLKIFPEWETVTFDAEQGLTIGRRIM